MGRQNLDLNNCDFFMVTLRSGQGAKVEHPTYNLAITEAQRLANLHQTEAYVVGVVASVRPVIKPSTIRTRF